MKKNNKILVYVWFDVEDYVTPEANNPPLQAVRILKKYKIPATYKLVAEKVRFLKEKKRQDVIAAIKNYCNVGYHTDTHSRHPIVYEYIANMDLLRGSREIEKREGRGLREFRSTFGGTPACFGHAGSQWAPHYYPFLKNAGIPVYMDATDIVNIDDSPYWYCGVLCLNNSNKNLIVFDRSFETPVGNQKLRNRFKSIHDRLKRKKKHGAISVLWHPHTAVTKVFWDALNFANGKNASKGKYVQPERQPAEIKERALRDLDKLLEFASSFEDVQFISAREATRVYRRRIEMELGVPEVKWIADRIARSKGISYFELGNEFISPAQAFSALTNFTASYSRVGSIPKRTTMGEPLGPISRFESKAKTKTVYFTELLSASERVSESITSKGFMSSNVRVGDSTSLSPSDYLATLAAMLSSMLALNKRQPQVRTEHVVLRQSKMTLEDKFVNPAAFKAACRWSILPRNFSAPKILEQARLQTWTLVPAVARI